MKGKIVLAIVLSTLLCLLISLTACEGTPTTSGVSNQSTPIVESSADSSIEDSIDDSTANSSTEDSVDDSTVDSSTVDSADSSVNNDSSNNEDSSNSSDSSSNNEDSSADEYVCEGCGKVLNVNEKHEICEYCGGFLCLGDHEKCGNQGGNEKVCNHTAEGLTAVGSEEVICAWVDFYPHYYCEVCEKYFYYDETAITVFVECGDCNGDKQDGHFCSTCQRMVRELCSHCSSCLACCECNFEDLTTYCPQCSNLVTYYEGFEPACDHPGFYDTYQCGWCDITYRIEGGTYIIIENGFAEIPPLGHRTENGVPVCLNCGYIYSESVCVGCLKSENACGTCCFDYYSTSFVRPIEYTAQLRTQIGDVWVRLDFYYNERNNSASLDYKLKSAEDYGYIEIATITASARRIGDYVVEFVPTAATVYYRNYMDIGFDFYGSELQIDSTKISYFSIENTYQYWEDGSNEGASSRLFAYMNYPFEVCEDCHGIATLGGHGECGEEGCGKSLCAGHVHGECDHENVEEYYESYCGMAMHYKCNDCNQILYASYNGMSEYLEVCEECIRIKEEMGGSDGKEDGSNDGYGSGSEGGDIGGGMGVNVTLNGEMIFVPYFNLCDLIYEHYGDPSNVKYIVYNGMLCENVEEMLYVVMCEGDVIEIG